MLHLLLLFLPLPVFLFGPPLLQFPLPCLCFRPLLASLSFSLRLSMSLPCFFLQLSGKLLCSSFFCAALGHPLLFLALLGGLLLGLHLITVFSSLDLATNLLVLCMLLVVFSTRLLVCKVMGRLDNCMQDALLVIQNFLGLVLLCFHFFFCSGGCMFLVHNLLHFGFVLLLEPLCPCLFRHHFTFPCLGFEFLGMHLSIHSLVVELFGLQLLQMLLLCFLFLGELGPVLLGPLLLGLSFGLLLPCTRLGPPLFGLLLFDPLLLASLLLHSLLLDPPLLKPLFLGPPLLGLSLLGLLLPSTRLFLPLLCLLLLCSLLLGPLFLDLPLSGARLCLPLLGLLLLDPPLLGLPLLGLPLLHPPLLLLLLLGSPLPGMRLCPELLGPPLSGTPLCLPLFGLLLFGPLLLGPPLLCSPLLCRCLLLPLPGHPLALLLLSMLHLLLLFLPLPVFLFGPPLLQFPLPCLCFRPLLASLSFSLRLSMSLPCFFLQLSGKLLCSSFFCAALGHPLLFLALLGGLLLGLHL